MSGLVLAVFVPAGYEAPIFFVLVTLATFIQLFKAVFQSHQVKDTGTTSYSPTLIFFFAGVVLLPPALFVALVILPHLVEWANERLRKTKNLPVWYLQPFNISTHIIVGLAAGWVYRTLNVDLTVALSPTPVIVAMVTVAVYVLFNHFIIGMALVLARNVSWKESGVWDTDNLTNDGIMINLGYAIAVLWVINPWMILPALAPLILIQRSLMVPQLKQEARLDPETPFSVDTSPTPIHVTLSVGISHFPSDGTSQRNLIHLADIAVYQAKLLGRNCTVWGAEIPHALHLETQTAAGSPSPGMLA